MQKEKISKEIIKSRYEIFNEAKKRIKNEFYGIDDVIEKVFKSIETWYIYPEFMTRPCIINLWGLTGVGKTDLVQKIRTYLKIDKYASTEMDNNSNSYEEMATNNYVRQESKSIFDLLNQSEILPSSHAILLLDEIHRYRTIDENKKIITRNRYGDLWKLLSDGSLIDSTLGITVINSVIADIETMYDNIRLNSTNQAEKLEDKINILFGNSSISKEQLDKEKKEKDAMIKKLGYIPYGYGRENLAASEYDNFLKGSAKNIDLNNLIYVIDVDEDDIEILKKYKLIYQGWDNFLVNEIFFKSSNNSDLLERKKKYISTCSNKIILEWLKEKKKKLIERFNELDATELRKENMRYVYNKLLIFICGNTEKEMYDSNTKEIKTDIREYVNTLFRPEQVSRFGNTYIEYPILNKDVYDKIIMNEIEYTENRLNREYETDKIKFDKDEIYKLVIEDLPKDYIFNGVRPIYSAVQRVLSNIIPKILINIYNEEK